MDHGTAKMEDKTIALAGLYKLRARELRIFGDPVNEDRFDVVEGWKFNLE